MQALLGVFPGDGLMLDGVLDLLRLKSYMPLVIARHIISLPFWLAMIPVNAYIRALAVIPYPSTGISPLSIFSTVSMCTHTYLDPNCFTPSSHPLLSLATSFTVYSPCHACPLVLYTKFLTHFLHTVFPSLLDLTHHYACVLANLHASPPVVTRNSLCLITPGCPSSCTYRIYLLSPSPRPISL